MNEKIIIVILLVIIITLCGYIKMIIRRRDEELARLREDISALLESRRFIDNAHVLINDVINNLWCDKERNND